MPPPGFWRVRAFFLYSVERLFVRCSGTLGVSSQMDAGRMRYYLLQNTKKSANNITVSNNTAYITWIRKNIFLCFGVGFLKQLVERAGRQIPRVQRSCGLVSNDSASWASMLAAYLKVQG